MSKGRSDYTANTTNAVCLENGVCDAWASDIWAKVIWANHLLPPPPAAHLRSPTNSSVSAGRQPKALFRPCRGC